MTTVTVFRHPPPPVIGVCGVVFDRAFEAFEQNLDWLEATGVLGERIDPHEEPEEAARPPAAGGVPPGAGMPADPPASRRDRRCRGRMIACYCFGR
jgi:hypothetical protein